MPKFDQTAFDQFVIANDVIGFFPEGKTLASGRFSYWYANCRRLIDKVGTADKTVDFLLAFLKDKGVDFDYIYGVPAGATAFATIANYKRGMAGNPSQPLVIGREKPKEHGDPKDKYFVGPAKEGDRVILLEDVTTTGGSALKEHAKLVEAGIKVVGLVAIVNRLEFSENGKDSVEECFTSRGTKYYSMTDAGRMLPLAVAKYNPAADLLEKVKEQHNKFAIRRISL